MSRTGVSAVVEGTAKPTFVAAYVKQDRSLGEQLGVSDAIKPGEVREVVITFSNRQQSGAKLLLLIHEDMNNNGTLEYPGPDVPAENQFGITIAEIEVP